MTERSIPTLEEIANFDYDALPGIEDLDIMAELAAVAILQRNLLGTLAGQVEALQERMGDPDGPTVDSAMDWCNGLETRLGSAMDRLVALEGASGGDPTDLEDAYRDLVLARDEMSVHVEVAKAQRLRAEAAEREVARLVPIEEAALRIDGHGAGVLALLDALDVAEKQRDSDESSFREALTAIRHVTAERDAARAAVERYGKHERWCLAWGIGKKGQPCTCGLAEALKETPADA